MIKGGMVFYRETLSEIGEMASDLVAEARAELEQNSGSERAAAAGDGGIRAGLPAEPHQPAG